MSESDEGSSLNAVPRASAYVSAHKPPSECSNETKTFVNHPQECFGELLEEDCWSFHFTNERFCCTQQLQNLEAGALWRPLAQALHFFLCPGSLRTMALLNRHTNPSWGIDTDHVQNKIGTKSIYSFHSRAAWARFAYWALRVAPSLVLGH